MRKTLVFAACVLLASPTFAREGDRVLEFDTMVGVFGAFRGATNPVRGVGGGGAAWRLDNVKGDLRADGRLDIKVEGLVLAEGANEGTNPAATFRAIVSCLIDNGDATVGTQNVMTDEFPATPQGDSRIEAFVSLPSPCVAPIVFVTNAAGRWFAATGL